MTITALLGLSLLVGGAWYWFYAMRAKEIACRAGRERCREIGALLLDDTVVLTRVRLRRDDEGHLSFYREFRFEFTSDGNTRHRGKMSLLGGHILQLHMDPYRIGDIDGNT